MTASLLLIPYHPRVSKWSAVLFLLDFLHMDLCTEDPFYHLFMAQ